MWDFSVFKKNIHITLIYVVRVLTLCGADTDLVWSGCGTGGAFWGIALGCRDKKKSPAPNCADLQNT